MSGIAILGAGSWGTALSALLTKNGQRVSLWARRKEAAELLSRERVNKEFLPGLKIAQEVLITHVLEEAVGDASVVIMAVPSHGLREACKRLKGMLQGQVVVSGVKGLEVGTSKRMSEVMEEELGGQGQGVEVGVFSGPSHAEEVCQGLPTSVVVASRKEEVAKELQSVLGSTYFRVYTHDDLIGVEMGGALKNIIAIASGICEGLGLGINAKATLMTRGLAEMVRLGVAMGARAITFSGLSGMGDLITTCMSPYSRNRHLGSCLAQGMNLEEYQRSHRMVAEGINTTPSALQLARARGVEMPITEKVYAVLYQGLQPQEALKDLLYRSPKPEWEGVL